MFALCGWWSCCSWWRIFTFSHIFITTSAIKYIISWALQKSWFSWSSTTIIVLVAISRILEVSLSFAIKHACVGGDIENFGLFEWTFEHKRLNIAIIEQTISIISFIACIENIWLCGWCFWTINFGTRCCSFLANVQKRIKYESRRTLEKFWHSCIAYTISGAIRRFWKNCIVGAHKRWSISTIRAWLCCASTANTILIWRRTKNCVQWCWSVSNADL